VAAKQVFPDDAVTGSKGSMSAQDCRASSWRAVVFSAGWRRRRQLVAEACCRSTVSTLLL
jgi:hypothetical protein